MHWVLCVLSQIPGNGKRLDSWIQRPGFAIRKIVILKWIVLGNILTLGYKTTLLSSLVPIRYEDTIDNINDFDKSELPLLLPEGTTFVDNFKKDPRKVMARIFSKRILFNIDGGGIPSWVYEM